MRDRLIDGYRGIAVLCVVCAHALAYKLQLSGYAGREFSRLADPLAEMGVQLFFVISGYIITSLLVREESTAGRISIPAFYIRRFFRILPPLFCYFAALFGLRFVGAIQFDPATIRNSALFTCNTGLTSCEWWVAHTWSLAVEEQFYLAWPLLLVVLPSERRVQFLVIALALLLGGFLASPFQFHSNWISFACIAAGATYALSPRVRDWIKRGAFYATWFVAVAFFGLDPFLHLSALLALTPLLILFILFGSRELQLISRVLEAPPLQAIGLCSYSLYLWQQLFLARPDNYLMSLHVAALPVLVGLSFFLIERPFSRIGHRLSNAVKTRFSERQIALTDC